MKNVLKTIIAFLLVVSMFIPINVQAAPTSDMLVMDNAKTLSLDEEKKIESALYQIYEQSGIEYAVMIIDSLKGDSIENVANEQFRNLGLGDSDNNNGLLILISMNDHKFRMEVGYGLEGVITDTKAKEIINCMTNYFKQDDYTDGILASITKTVEILNASGEYNISQDENYIPVSSASKEINNNITTFIIISLLIIIVIIDIKTGGYTSGSGGGYSSFDTYSDSSGGSFGGGSSGGGGASGGW
mgnify:FL=1